jgi:hypothetical protein
VFLPIDVDAILRTPIRGTGEDILAWSKEKHGCYSGRSAYKLLDAERQQQEDMLTTSTSNNETWKRIWKLDVPPKVKVFWWRVINEFLPTKKVLHGRHIEPIAICDTCGGRWSALWLGVSGSRQGLMLV